MNQILILILLLLVSCNLKITQGTKLVDGGQSGDTNSQELMGQTIKATLSTGHDALGLSYGVKNLIVKRMNMKLDLVAIERTDEFGRIDCKIGEELWIYLGQSRIGVTECKPVSFMRLWYENDPSNINLMLAGTVSLDQSADYYHIYESFNIEESTHSLIGSFDSSASNYSQVLNFLSAFRLYHSTLYSDNFLWSSDDFSATAIADPNAAQSLFESQDEFVRSNANQTFNGLNLFIKNRLSRKLTGRLKSQTLGATCFSNLDLKFDFSYGASNHGSGDRASITNTKIVGYSETLPLGWESVCLSDPGCKILDEGLDGEIIGHQFRTGLSFVMGAPYPLPGSDKWSDYNLIFLQFKKGETDYQISGLYSLNHRTSENEEFSSCNYEFEAKNLLELTSN